MKEKISSPAARLTLPTYVVLAVLCVAQFLDAMDISSMGIIAPIVQADLGMNPQSLQWIVSGYALGFGGFLLLGGRTADLFGRRRVFLVSMSLFALASLVGGLAANEAILVGARIAKGIFAGFTAPAALSLLLAQYTNPAGRNRAIGVYSASSAIGFALGMVIGGLLGDISWRLVFFLPVPVALAVIVVGALAIKPDNIRRARVQYDLIGAVMATASLLAIAYGATQAASYGWSSAHALISLGAGTGLLAGFLSYEHKIDNPLLPLGIFRRTGLGFASAVAFIMQGTYTGLQFVMALYLQTVLQWSAFQSALAFAISGLIIAAFATKFATLASRVGPMPLIVGGLTVQTFGYAWVLLLGDIPTLWLVGVMGVLFGFGIAATYPAVNVKGLSQTQDTEHGLASGIILSSFSIGGGVVLAIAASVFAVSGSEGLGKYTTTTLLLMALSAIMTVLATWTWHRNRKTYR